VVLKEDLPAMKDTAGRAGLHVRSSKDYLLCHRLIYWFVQLVSVLLLLVLECSAVGARNTRLTRELIVQVDFIFVICVRLVKQVASAGGRGMRAILV
jgi:hypothetical protein